MVGLLSLSMETVADAVEGREMLGGARIAWCMAQRSGLFVTDRLGPG